jgi:hypothetical protein
MNKPIKTVKPFFKVNFEDLQFAKDFFENEKHYIEWLFCISEYYQGNIIDPKTKIVAKYFNNYKKTMDFIIESKIKGLEGAILKAEKQQVNNETLEGVVEGGFKEPLQQIINNKELNIKDENYRAFAHLSISINEFHKLEIEYHKKDIDLILDDIQNYAKNKTYRSLYLTAKKWLRDIPKKGQEVKQHKTGDDILYENVMRQMELAKNYQP